VMVITNIMVSRLAEITHWRTKTLWNFTFQINTPGYTGGEI